MTLKDKWNAIGGVPKNSTRNISKEFWNSYKEFFNNNLLGLISVLLIEAIYFYNFTTPEFNVNVCQLPFWSLTAYYAWRIFNGKNIKFSDCFLVGLFAAFGFLSKYLFLYLLVSIDLLFVYLIFIKKDRKFDFKYLITTEVFLVALVPHFIWLTNNEFITITYGRRGRRHVRYGI